MASKNKSKKKRPQTNQAVASSDTGAEMECDTISHALQSFDLNSQRFTPVASVSQLESSDDNHEMNCKYRQRIIELNVGGHYFCTSLFTLLKYDESYFSLIFKNDPQLIVSGKPLFIDRDGTYFRYILNYLRDIADLPSDKQFLRELLSEVKFYLLDSFQARIEQKLNITSPITQNQLEKCILNAENGIVPGDIALDFKDLRGLIFRKLTFEGKIDFEYSNLTDAMFEECVFSKRCIFDSCEMCNVKFIKCTGLQNASFIGSKINAEASFEKDTLDKLKELKHI